MTTTKPTLIQIPFSHNCVKVRTALDRKGIDYEVDDIRPMDRRGVRQASGQFLVPVLVDGGTAIADSTAILRHLEDAYPARPLLPADTALRAECWVLEDWADRAFMTATRRLAYARIIATPGGIEALFFPRAGGLRRALLGRVARRALRKRFRISPGSVSRDAESMRELAPLALERLGGRPVLVGDAVTVADVALAAMAAPLAAADEAVSGLDAVRRLVDWCETIVGAEMMSFYRSTPEELARRMG